MQDTIIKGTGDSRSLKCPPNLLATYPTWEAAAQALQNGTFPVDIGNLNPLGCLQIGTGYTKGEVLPADLQASLNLPDSATPADAFTATLEKAKGYDLKLETGTYAGTGPAEVSLVFNFMPKIIFISGYFTNVSNINLVGRRSFAVISGNGTGVGFEMFNETSGNYGYGLKVLSIGKTGISWTSIINSAMASQNYNGVNYFYTAIG